MRPFVGNVKEWSSVMRIKDEEVNKIRKAKSKAKSYLYFYLSRRPNISPLTQALHRYIYISVFNQVIRYSSYLINKKKGE